MESPRLVTLSEIYIQVLAKSIDYCFTRNSEELLHSADGADEVKAFGFLLLNFSHPVSFDDSWPFFTLILILDYSLLLKIISWQILTSLWLANELGELIDRGCACI